MKSDWIIVILHEGGGEDIIMPRGRYGIPNSGSRIIKRDKSSFYQSCCPRNDYCCVSLLMLDAAVEIIKRPSKQPPRAVRVV